MQSIVLTRLAVVYNDSSRRVDRVTFSGLELWHSDVRILSSLICM
jgi:hypothetical protein